MRVGPGSNTGLARARDDLHLPGNGGLRHLPSSTFGVRRGDVRALEVEPEGRPVLGGELLRMGLDGHDPTPLRLGEVQSQVPGGHQEAGAPLPVEMALPERGTPLGHLLDLAPDLAQVVVDGEQSGPERHGGLLPISWSRDHGSHGCDCSVSDASFGLSSIGTYLSHVAANSAGVSYPNELCGRSVLYS